jgi:hypothetical protein
VDDRDLPCQDSDNEGVEEAEMEDEELWRRTRHEREMFLQQQKVCTNFINKQGPGNNVTSQQAFFFAQVSSVQ